MGRQRIQIEKIDCASKRRATFAKRSRGLLKKAKELAVLCDFGVGLVILSPTGKPQVFSNRPSIAQLLQRFNDNTQQGNEAGICSNDKDECKGGCCNSHLLESDDPSLPSSAHNHIQMQQPQVVEAPQGREQLHMQRVPFVEMANPSQILTSAPGQYRSSEVRGPDGASSYMPGPPVGGCEMAFFNGVQPYLLTCNLPGGEASKLEQFSNQPREQTLERFNHDIFPNTAEEEMANLQDSENVHIQMPIRCTQQESQAGMSSDDMEKWTSSLLELESFLLESEDPSSSRQLIDNVPPGSNPLSDMQSSHRHIPMQKPQGREQVQMQGVQSAEMGDQFSIRTFVPGQFMSSEVRGLDRASDYMQGPPVGGCEMAFFNGVQPSSSTCGLSDGDAGKLEHFCNVQSAHWHAPLQQLQELEAPFVQMQAAPSVETGDPSLYQTSVPWQFPHGDSDYMLNPPGVGYEMPLFNDEELELATQRWWPMDE